MPRLIILVLLAVTSTIHLIDSWKDNSKRRAYTKPFLLLFILLYYILSPVEHRPVLIGALAASWLGDVLLIPKGNKWFTMGGIAFMLAHFLFIAVYVPQVNFSAVIWPVVIPAAIIYYSISAVIIYKLTPTTPKMMLAPMYVYLLSNSTMNIFSLMQLISNPCKASIVAYIGAVLFFISDCTLFLVRYHKNKDLIFKRHFTVMLTYIIGELMITIGMVMLTQ